jgi:glycosyltransferase involved in cell wall biosynthesis
VRRLEEVIADTRPDIAHFHNTFFMISPAAYYACQRAGVPVVQTLHNFRLGCVNACCTIGGKPCQACISMPFAWPGIVNACYRESRAASAAVAGIAAVHKTIGTYRRQVDAYVSLSEFARAIHLRSGIPANLSFLKPNFSSAPAPPSSSRQDYAFYAGRMVHDKGLYVLLDAWTRLKSPFNLKLAGDGPDLEHLRSQFAHVPGVAFLGQLPRAHVQDLMANASCFIQPSLLLENCGLVVIEALAGGLPSIVSGHGSFAEIVEDGHTGLHFRPGDSADLAEKVEWVRNHPEESARMGLAARERFDERYSPEKNYGQLMCIYEAARRRHAVRHA